MFQGLRDRWRKRQRWHTISIQVNDNMYETLEQIQIKTGLPIPELIRRAVFLYDWANDQTVLGRRFAFIDEDDDP